MNEIGLLCCNVNLDFNLDNGLPHSSSTIQIWNRWEKSFHLRFSWQTKVQTSVETRTFLLFFLILFFADYVVIWKSICTIGRTSLVNEKNLSKVPQDVRKKNLQVWQNWNISIKMRVKPQKNNFGGHFNSHILRLIWFWIMWVEGTFRQIAVSWPGSFLPFLKFVPSGLHLQVCTFKFAPSALHLQVCT